MGIILSIELEKNKTTRISDKETVVLCPATLETLCYGVYIVWRWIGGLSTLPFANQSNFQL